MFKAKHTSTFVTSLIISIFSVLSSAFFLELIFSDIPPSYDNAALGIVYFVFLLTIIIWIAHIFVFCSEKWHYIINLFPLIYIVKLYWSQLEYIKNDFIHTDVNINLMYTIFVILLFTIIFLDIIGFFTNDYLKKLVI